MYEKAIEDGIEGFLEHIMTHGRQATDTREIKKQVERNENLQEELPSWLNMKAEGSGSLGNLFDKNEDVYFDNGLTSKEPEPQNGQ